MTTAILDSARYEIERAICDRAAAYADSIMRPAGGPSRNWLSAEEAAHPDYAACDNAMRGRVEQFEILRDLPETIFAYIGNPACESNCRAAVPYPVTVWTGDRIGTAYESARWKTPGSYVSSTMHQYRATIGGRQYTGRGPGVGMYVRLRETAASKRARSDLDSFPA